MGTDGRCQRSGRQRSVRAPLIVSAPGRKGAGRSSKALVEFVDIYPTLADLCGLDPPADLEGLSLKPLLDDPDRRWKRAAFSQVEWEGRIYGRTVRTDRYRYIHWRGDGGGEELYDHAEDPREFTNLAGDSQHAAALERMRRVLKAGWRAALDGVA